MVNVNDLIPSISGRSHFGVNGGTNLYAFGEIVPFGHAHMLSGIFHDPLHGQSGILRFSTTKGDFEKSLDGGATFNRLPTSVTEDLQNTYEAGNTIFLDSSNGDLEIATAASKFIVQYPAADVGDKYSPLNMSGISTTPDTDMEPGDVSMIYHSNIFDLATTRDIARAESYGFGALVIDTGSGVINVDVGSGIAQFSHSNITNQVEISYTFNSTYIPFDRVDFEDHNYAIDDTTPDASGIRIMTPGLYECYYKIMGRRTGGSTRAVMVTHARLNNVAIDGSWNQVYLRDSTDRDGSGSSRFLFNADAGDIIKVTPYMTAGVAGTDTADIVVFQITTPSRLGSHIILRKLGPRRND